MSLSPAPRSAVYLYCDEVADDDDDHDRNDDEEVDSLLFPYLDSSDDDERFVLALFDSELDAMFMLGSERSPAPPECIGARQDVVNWMLKVHSYYSFRPETAYLSVTYLHRFLRVYNLPGKEWSLQLLSVACISLAAKMEETAVPLLLDLQVMEPGFLFTAMTVQKMELLVMAALKWRLRIATPFSFLHYFTSKLPCFPTRFHNIRNASDLILSSFRVMDHLDFLPSSIAAASLLWATGKNVDDQTLALFHKRVNKEMVKRCLYLIQEKSMCSVGHAKRQRLEAVVPLPPSPDGVLDADISESCGASCGALQDSKSSLD